MICTIHQPSYIPWIGFFHKISISDIFVILDDVEYSKNNFFNRNKIKTSNGPTLLSLPIISKEKDTIKEVKLATNINWQKKHWKSIELAYQKSEYFSNYKKTFEEIYKKQWTNMSDLNIELIKTIMNILNIKTRVVNSSELNVEGSSTERLINICKKVNATEYIAGIGGKNYLKEDLFKKNNIKLTYQQFNHPAYEQKFGEFIPNMSIIDLIFNHGPKSMEIIKQFNTF